MNLLEMAKNGTIYKLPQNLQKLVNSGEKDTFGNSPLHYAAMHGHLDKLPKNLLTPKTLMERNIKGWTVFHAAARNGHLDQIPENLLRVEYLRDQKDGAGCTPVTLAAEFGHLDQIPATIESLDNTLKAMEDGRTLLHAAAYGRQTSNFPPRFLKKQLRNWSYSNSRNCGKHKNMASALLKIPNVSHRKLTEYKYTKDIPKTLIEADKESMPTAVVSNRQITTFYTSDPNHWENNSELGTPWVPKSSTEIVRSGISTKVNTLVRFTISEYSRGSKSPELDINEEFIPKPNVKPFAYQGWSRVWGYPIIQPHSALYKKEDCYPVTESKDKRKVSISISDLNKDELTASLAYFEDPRFQLVEVSSCDCEFVVIGKLTPDEWEELYFTPKPTAPNPCGMDDVVANNNDNGCTIPPAMYGKIEPEWCNDGQFLISYKTALKESKKHPKSLPTPEEWVQKVETNEYHYQWQRAKGNNTISVEMSKLAGSTLLLSTANWEDDKIYFNVDNILVWPNTPLSCSIDYSRGILSNSPQDETLWQRVRQDSCNDGITFLYQNPDHKKGYHKITVRDIVKQSAEVHAHDRAEKELGVGFEKKYEDYLTFVTDEVDTYIELAKFIDSNTLAEWPSYIEKKRKTKRHQHGIYTKDEVKNALEKIPDTVSVGNSDQEALLVQLILQKNLPIDSQKILLETLAEINATTGDLVKDILKV